MAKGNPAKVEQEDAMHKNKAEAKYSFGKMSIEISLDGNIDRPTEQLDHMLATASAVAGIEAIQLGLSGSNTSENRSSQQFQNSTEFGGETDKVRVDILISLELSHHVANRKLNDMVFGAILPTIYETAAVYFGDHQEYTTPQQPLVPVSRSANRWATREALSIAPPRPTLFDAVDESSDRSARRAMSTH